MPRTSCIRCCLLIVAAVVLQPDRGIADNRHFFVVITPPPRPQPSPQPSFPVQPPLQWAPPLALGRTPGVRSPTARCYAGTQVCPLPDPGRVGEPCSCATEGATQLGRALIPPSYDIAGRPL